MRFLLSLFLSMYFVGRVSAMQLDDIKLPDLASSRVELLDKMPRIDGIHFDPVEIELYNSKLNEFNLFVIEYYNIDLKNYCDHINSFDGYYRNVLISSGQGSWGEYDASVKDLLRAETSKCDHTNKNSEYIRLYDQAIYRLKQYQNSYSSLRRKCDNDTGCKVGNSVVVMAADGN